MYTFFPVEGGGVYSSRFSFVPLILQGLGRNPRWRNAFLARQRFAQRKSSRGGGRGAAGKHGVNAFVSSRSRGDDRRYVLSREVKSSPTSLSNCLGKGGWQPARHRGTGIARSRTIVNALKLLWIHVRVHSYGIACTRAVHAALS